MESLINIPTAKTALALIVILLASLLQLMLTLGSLTVLTEY
jgi:hypothetical protein